MLITYYQALSKDGADWTGAFRQAILDLQDGGVLEVPAGEYPTFPITLKSHMELRVREGAALRFLDDPAGFEVISAEFEGIPGTMHTPCLFADKAADVKITGAGLLDGSGARWWQASRDGTLQHARPFLMCFRECRDVLLDGVTLVNSPVWTVHPQYCDGVTVRAVTIINPPDSPNTDGIDPDSCERVRIQDCVIDVGDDCIAIKAGTEDTPVKRPCRDITVTGCRMRHGHGGVVIGSEMSGNVSRVAVSDCVFTDTDRGIRVKTRRLRGGAVTGLSFSDIRMSGVMCPFVFNMFYFCGKGGRLPLVSDKTPHPMEPGTPSIRGVTIQRVDADGCSACAGFFYGLPESPLENITLRDVTVRMTDGPAACPAMMEGCPWMRRKGFYIRNVKGLATDNVRVEGADGPDYDRG